MTATRRNTESEPRSDIETSAMKQVPSSVENMTVTGEPVLCPHVCGAYAGAGALGGVYACHTTQCSSPHLDSKWDETKDIGRDASIDELVRAAERAD